MLYDTNCYLTPLNWQINFRPQESQAWDFPGGPVIKNPPSNAGDMGSIPVWGTKIIHAVGQISTSTQLNILQGRPSAAKI